MRPSRQITAKVTCHIKEPRTGPNGAPDGADLDFCAVYGDERNKEWARNTPVCNIHMVLGRDAADLFEQGRSYLLTFTPEDEQPTNEPPADFGTIEVEAPAEPDTSNTVITDEPVPATQ